MEMRSAVMDQILTAAQPRQNAAQSNAKSSDSSDFGGMVQRKQQEVRGQDARDAKSAQTSDAKKPTDAANASQRTQDAPDEQYAIAAAMMMQAWLQMVPFNVTPEQRTLDVEITPTFMPEMRTEVVVETALEQVQAKPEEIVTATEHQDFQQVVERVYAVATSSTPAIFAARVNSETDAVGSSMPFSSAFCSRRHSSSPG